VKLGSTWTPSAITLEVSGTALPATGRSFNAGRRFLPLVPPQRMVTITACHGKSKRT
jgi:hypothetical protein